jgi:recombinational DNA repair protein (RecF pathway)
MKEYLTEAIVLNVRPRREFDRTADFYTKELGRLEARVIGGRRILSKFSPHLVVPSLVTVRLVKKGGLTLVDIMTEENFPDVLKKPAIFAKVLELLFLIRKVVPMASADLHLWYALLRSLRSGRVSMRIFLKILGYDVSGAACQICLSRSIRYFVPADQTFVCQKCRGKFSGNGLIYIQ